MTQQHHSPDVNKQVVRRFVEECWNQGNFNKTSELLADKVHFHDPVFPNINSGIQNIKQHIETSRKAFPDLKFTIDDTIAERNEVVVHWTAYGTHKGPFLGIEPTNRKVTIEGTSIYRLEGAKIAEAHANWNLATMMVQLGVIEVPKEARADAKQEPKLEAKSRV
ncbi:MAG: ester cyclase [Terracidiphilus sp.]